MFLDLRYFIISTETNSMLKCFYSTLHHNVLKLRPLLGNTHEQLFRLQTILFLLHFYWPIFKEKVKIEYARVEYRGKETNSREFREDK